jgi:hypothetical protein
VMNESIVGRLGCLRSRYIFYPWLHDLQERKRRIRKKAAQSTWLHNAPMETISRVPKFVFWLDYLLGRTCMM